ncbi:monosaccharide-transporting ATPase (plasmid) [Maritalea myrionectae]|uniref:Monosaccharide-transporting ATPase n=1 Tax=Maritalea myrionectae TaxID=454601 RepID=A0A2R4MJR2_9HYPH|nr:ABC transporter ATP-binding protein [Maritalea myrionectae]AVX06237.1 monosaccharide-transporting ATPase [Maritalea myrionectae]
MTDDSIKVEVKNLTLQFPETTASTQKKSGFNKPLGVTALQHVSLDIHSGERVGLLGANGAGKSTFLGVLAGVYPVEKGSVKLTGESIAILNVRVGMDLDATGYDNITLLMAARSVPLSMLTEVRKFVEEFTELGEALDRPVRTYSAGMRLRLAFAVATFRSAQIVLLDEVVGVGDSSFRKKSKQQIDKLTSNAGILVVASHSNSYLRTYCNRGLVFKKGSIVFDGPIDEAISFFESQK